MTFHTISRWILALMIALVAAGMSFGHVAAASADGAGQPRANMRLAQMYRVEQLRLRVQGERLNRTNLFAARFDTLIAKLKAKGQNTVALEQALAAFRAATWQARAEWNAAKSTLVTHAGFGAGGNMTDAAQARATVQAAHDHMQQAHVLAKGAFRDLRAAFVAYRKAHRNVPDVPAPIEP
jgi:hypothetical protein